MKHKWKRWLVCMLFCGILVSQGAWMKISAMEIGKKTISEESEMDDSAEEEALSNEENKKSQDDSENGDQSDSVEEEEWTDEDDEADVSSDEEEQQQDMKNENELSVDGQKEETLEADNEKEVSADEDEEWQDEAEAEDISEEYNLTRKEIRQSVTDAVYENEIKNRANLKYTKVDELKIVNAVVVKQTLFDSSLVEEGDTIGSIMGGIEEGDEQEADKFLTQISNVVALYELSGESDYYVAFVNTMDSDQNAEVKDYVFALNDNDGTVLSDCIYEAETGLAYIPKSDCINEDGEQIILNVQIQLMQVVSPEDASSEIVTSVKEDASTVLVSASEAGIFDVETTVETEKGLDEEEMTVAVNGVPIQEEYYAYDAESGELTLNQSAAMIQSVSISVEEDSALEKLSKLLLFPATEAYALTADQMTAVAENIELPDWVETNTLMIGSASYQYSDKSPWTYSYGFGTNSEKLLAEMIDLIEYGGALDMSRIVSQAVSNFITVHADLSTNTLMNNGRSISGLQNIPILNMECCHVDTALGSTSGSDVVGGKWSLQPIRLRFLNVDREQGYAIIGIYTIETHTQTGCAFFKIGIKPSYGYGNIEKKDAQTDEVVEGAVYQVYTDSDCTVNATDVDGNVAVFTTTASEPYSNTITMSPGIYYVKETQAPNGYMLDSGVKILNIRSGESTYATATGEDSGCVYDNRQVWLALQKVSGDENLTADNACYSLEGAVYGVYQSSADAISDINRLATLQTEESGNTNMVQVDAGTYYIRELQASPGYGMCNGEGDMADADGIHTVEATNYGETYSVTCAEPVLGSSFQLQMRKWDLDTNKQAAQGQASLAGAIFCVEYYDNTEGICTKTPKRIWYYKTDESGVVYGSDTGKLLQSLSLNNQLLSGDKDVFVRTGSGEYVLPLGTYHISEVRAPAYYQLAGLMKLEGETGAGTDVSLGKTLVVKEDKDMAVIYNGADISSGALSVEQLPVNVYDKVYRGSITITKQDAEGKPLPNVSFRIKGEMTGEEYTAVTDQNGEVSWSNLLPQKYRVTEIKTAEGQSLLEDEITIVLPLEVAGSEVTDDLDLSKAVWDLTLEKYCFYDISYEITNHARLVMPNAGGFPLRRVIFSISGVTVVLLGVFWFSKSRKRELQIWKGVGK